MNQRPMFLLCNDDGVHAPGLHTLAEEVAELGDVYIVAPSMERSATSQAITISNPLRIEQLPDRPYCRHIYEVNGSPADSAKIALARLLPRKPDWVLSGINRGGNLGQDTLYSGTVGAAMEGVINSCKAMAISCHGKQQDRKNLNYRTAAKVVSLLLAKAEHLAFAYPSLLNVNVPSLPFAELRGIVAATLGRRIYHNDYIEAIDPRGQPYYWLGAEGDGFEDIAGSDCRAVEDGYASISVLQPSLLHQGLTAKLHSVLPSLFSSEFA